MKYQIRTEKTFEKIFGKIPIEDQKKIRNKVRSLSDDPRPVGVEKLKGKEELYRVRQGVYRIVYTIEDKQLLVLVLDIDHRKDIYR